MGFDFGKEIMEGVNAFKDNEMLKTAATFLGAQIGALLLAAIVAVAAVFMLVGSNIALGGFSREQLGALGLPALAAALVLLMALVVALVFIKAFFAMKYTLRALELSGFKGAKKMQYWDYVMMGVRWWLSIFFTVYEKRIMYVWLGGYAAALLLFIAGIAVGGTSGALVMLAALPVFMVALLAHTFGMVYHDIRLALAPLYFFQHGMKDSAPLAESWKQMEGRALEYFGIMLVLGVVSLIVAAPVLIVGMIAGMAIDPFADTLVNLLAGPFLLILTFKYEAQIFRYFGAGAKNVKLVEVKKGARKD